MKNIHFRSDYAHAKDGLGELSRLILDVFGIDISSLDRLGHDPSVVAFGWWQDEHLIANVSLYERQLWLAGHQVTAFGVQSVATRPEWRRRGLFSHLMSQALDYADQRSDLVILATGTPDLYTRFGFRQISESRFSSRLTQSRAASEFRELSLASDDDLMLLRHAFRNRVPTSFLASACDHSALFMLKANLTPAIRLLHFPELGAIAAITQSACSLHILDIVASRIPSVEEIVSAIGFKGARVEVYLTPDRFSWKPEESNRIDNGYMVRGSFALEGEPFMLSSMRI